MKRKYGVPAVSVIIATYNRPDYLCSGLISLGKQNVRDFEVIVVDDGSTEDVAEVTNQSWPFPLRLLRQENQGATSAKNAGASVAQGKILSFIDDDIHVVPGYVSALAETHASYTKSIVIGNLIPVPPKQASVFGQIQSKVDAPPNGLGGTSSVSFVECLSGFFSIRRKDFFELGVLRGVGDEWPNWDDVQLGYTAYQSGHEFIRAWDAIGYHHDVALSSLTMSRDRWHRASKAAPLLFRECPGLERHLRMFHDKTPVNWGSDPLPLVARKLVRPIASSGPMIWMMEGIVRILEEQYPSPAMLRLLYRWIVGGFIYRGYRKGLRECSSA